MTRSFSPASKPWGRAVAPSRAALTKINAAITFPFPVRYCRGVFSSLSATGPGTLPGGVRAMPRRPVFSSDDDACWAATLRTMRLGLAGGVVAFVALAGAVLADGHTASFSGSNIELRDTTEPGAVQELRFYNRGTNGPVDTGSRRDVTRGAVSATVTFRWDADATGGDSITVETDPNHVAVPRELTLPEYAEGIIHIFPLDSVGF